MGEIFLYHGSAGIIKAPVYGKGNGFNDYGCGFYCTGDKELAKEWACTGDTAAFVNIYELNTEGLRILDLASGYTLLYHIALLAEYRRFRILTSGIQSAVTWIKEHFRIELAGYDAVAGFRADDSYFSFVRAFLSNKASFKQLKCSILSDSCKQFVLKSKKALESLRFVSYEPVPMEEYYAKRKSRDEAARAAFQAGSEKHKRNGLYIQGLIREEVRPDDPRIQ